MFSYRPVFWLVFLNLIPTHGKRSIYNTFFLKIGITKISFAIGFFSLEGASHPIGLQPQLRSHDIFSFLKMSTSIEGFHLIERFNLFTGEKANIASTLIPILLLAWEPDGVVELDVSADFALTVRWGSDDHFGCDL